MAVMSNRERWACCNPAWRAFTARVVLPRVCAGVTLQGDVLELGSGAGANAAALLTRFPESRITATDLDPAMLESARITLARFGERALVRQADATSVEFDSASFDAVLSMMMLHHVGDWRAAVSEVARVLRPGGRLIGYDLTWSRPTSRRLHHPDPDHVYVAPHELRSAALGVGLADVEIKTALAGVIMRFSARKP